jgi:TusA-related sulfurtransferase
MVLARHVRALAPGQVVVAVSYDLGAREDLPAWCRLCHHNLLRVESAGRTPAGEEIMRFWIRRGPDRSVAERRP